MIDINSMVIQWNYYLLLFDTHKELFQLDMGPHLWPVTFQKTIQFLIDLHKIDNK